MRLCEFKSKGITAATVSRMVETGVVIRHSRGIYQLADAPLDANHSLAEAAKRGCLPGFGSGIPRID